MNFKRQVVSVGTARILSGTYLGWVPGGGSEAQRAQSSWWGQMLPGGRAGCAGSSLPVGSTHAAALGLAHAQLQQRRSPNSPLGSALPAQEGGGPGLRWVGKRQEGNRHPAVAVRLLQS